MHPQHSLIISSTIAKTMPSPAAAARGPVGRPLLMALTTLLLSAQAFVNSPSLSLCRSLADTSYQRTVAYASYQRTKGAMHCQSKVDTLRGLLKRGQEEIIIMPCAYDALSARLLELHGFPLAFMTGFGVSAVRAIMKPLHLRKLVAADADVHFGPGLAVGTGHPDTQLVSYGEMMDSARMIGEALRNIPCIADGDTGYGNAVNVKRTVKGYAQAGMQGVMIEDQVAPKRCGHTKGKAVVSREEAYARVQAAIDARNEGADMVILARTDARGVLGLDEAIERCKTFRAMGADITFLEAPLSEDEMRRYCREVEGPKLANMIQNGKTPVLPPKVLQEMGYTIVAYPFSLLSSSIKAMRHTLDLLKKGEDIQHLLATFDETKTVVGFDEYYEEEARYATGSSSGDGTPR